MAGTNPNEGPGWGDHNTPYGPIHSYTDPGSHASSGNGGQAHTGIGPNTVIHVPGTKDYSSSYMSQCVNNLKNHEGFVNSMYTDTAGNPTVGIGHLLASIDDALGLHFKYTYHQTGAGGSISDNEMNASEDRVRSEYAALKGRPTQRASIHLSNDDAIQQCIKDVQETEKGLKGLYKNYDSFPNSAKTGLVDMGFNLGISKLNHSFPKFNDAVNKGDWDTAAAESHRTGISNTRNQDTAKNFHDAGSGK